MLFLYLITISFLVSYLCVQFKSAVFPYMKTELSPHCAFPAHGFGSKFKQRQINSGYARVKWQRKCYPQLGPVLSKYHFNFKLRCIFFKTPHVFVASYFRLYYHIRVFSCEGANVWLWTKRSYYGKTHLNKYSPCNPWQILCSRKNIMSKHTKCLFWADHGLFV